MKLLCLNLWGGRQNQILFDYLKEQSVSTDVFCFQEVFDSVTGPNDYHAAHPKLYSELRALLPEFESVYAPTYSGWVDLEKVDFEVTEGQAIFVKKPLQIKNPGLFYIYGSEQTEILPDFSNEPKILQHCLVNIGGVDVLLANAHGKWHPGTKLDTPERLEQSKIITTFLKTQSGPKILCGDFNLMPNTESIGLVEQAGLKNLVKEFNITNTRNEISWREHHNKQAFADYAFTSADIKVNSLSAPYNEVSDHLPLILEFSI